MRAVIRPCNAETDVEGIASLLSSLEPEPVSVEDMRKWILHMPPGRIVLRLVAEEDGCLAGYAVANHEAWLPEGDYSAWIGVAEGRRHKGIGSALYAGIESFLASRLTTVVRSEVREAFPEALEFARRRGFIETRRIFESVLDLAGFDEMPFSGIRPRLEAEGFGFLSLAGLPEGRESQERLYRLNSAVCRDIPGEENDADIGFDEWVDLLVKAPWFRPEGQLLVEHRGELVALSAVQLFPEKRSAYNLVTGVLPACRRKGLATALKLEAVRYAKRSGASYIRANNDLTNHAMLSLNRKLGYKPEPGRILVEKAMPRPGSIPAD